MISGNVFVVCMISGCLAVMPASAALVANGNFSAGKHSAGDPVDNGWSNPGGLVVLDDLSAVAPDTFDASFPSGGALSQTLATSAGTNYTLSFLVYDNSPAFLDTFSVSLGGFTAPPIGGLDVSGAPPYTSETFAVPGSELLGNDVLSFSATSLNGNWHLEDVSVTAVAAPEPTSAAILLTALGLGGLSGVRRRDPNRGK